MIGVFLVMAFAAAVNCILFGRTCPPSGTVREMLEDTLVALISFAGGRMTAAK